MAKNDIQTLEHDLLIEAVFRLTGYDFTDYSKASFKRRIAHRMTLSGYKDFHLFLRDIIYKEELRKLFLLDMSVTVTEFFRDAHFFKKLKIDVLPKLATYPFIKIWHAGCATGQEVYSLCILLKEAGLLARTQIYATDYNELSLLKAKEGIFPLKDITAAAGNYKSSGGAKELSDYYMEMYDFAKFDKDLIKNVIFSHHNLTTDSVFAEVHLVLCRNVLIYFNTTLKNTVLSLFSDSLIHSGFLCLGTKESLDFSIISNNFIILSEKDRIYQQKSIVHKNKNIIDKQNEQNED